MTAPGPAPFPRLAFLQLLTSLASVPTYWSTLPRPVPPPKAFLVITLGRVQRKGQDDYVVTANATTGRFDAQLGGMRYVNFTLRASSTEPEAMPEDVLERVRWGLQTFTTQAALQAMAVGLVHLGDAMTYESRGDSRIIMNAAMDIRMVYFAGASPITAAVTPDPADYVAEVDEGGDIPIVVEP